MGAEKGINEGKLVRRAGTVPASINDPAHNAIEKGFI